MRFVKEIKESENSQNYLPKMVLVIYYDRKIAKNILNLNNVKFELNANIANV